MSRRSSRYSSRYESQWPEYVPVAERLRRAEQEMAKLRKKGVAITPVKLEGRNIATTFWGKAWCENLESYRDYANRLERGRSYVRNGSVVDLQIAPREVTARVSGSELYQVKITIGDVKAAHWKAICADCSGGIDSLVELLQGRFSKGVMERICRQGEGLFPKPSEIRFSCSCPDYASMCKHVAAVLYGVGARLDAMPELLFRLRAVDENELVADIGQALPMAKQAPAAGKVLETDDMAALFGLDMGEAETPGIGGTVTATERSPQVTATRTSKAKPAAPASKAKAAPKDRTEIVARTKVQPGNAAIGRKAAPARPAAVLTRGDTATAASIVSRKVKVAPPAPAKPESVRQPDASAAKSGVRNKAPAKRPVQPKAVARITPVSPAALAPTPAAIPAKPRVAKVGLLPTKAQPRAGAALPRG